MLLNGTRWIVVAVHSVLVAAFAHQSVTAALARLDPAYASLGASPAYVLWRVRLPLLLPSLTAAGLCFALSMGELSATMMLYLPDWTPRVTAHPSAGAGLRRSGPTLISGGRRCAPTAVRGSHEVVECLDQPTDAVGGVVDASAAELASLQPGRPRARHHLPPLKGTSTSAMAVLEACGVGQAIGRAGGDRRRERTARSSGGSSPACHQ
jgi:hypothetical protein